MTHIFVANLIKTIFNNCTNTFSSRLFVNIPIFLVNFAKFVQQFLLQNTANMYTLAFYKNLSINNNYTRNLFEIYKCTNTFYTHCKWINRIFPFESSCNSFVKQFLASGVLWLFILFALALVHPVISSPTVGIFNASLISSYRFRRGTTTFKTVLGTIDCQFFIPRSPV